MSDKPRKEFNAEDLANACLENKDCLKCPGLFICEAFDRVGAACPQYLDLTDPPRFTEAQMEFWKALYSVGVGKVFKAPSELKLSTKSTTLPTVGNMGSLTCEAWNWLRSGELLDLAELFGKEGTK